MRSSTASRIKLGIVFLLVVLIAALGLSGSLRIGKYRFYPFADFLDPGTDLGGGLSATWVAADAAAEGLDGQLDGAMAVLRARLDALDLGEATVARVGDSLRVEVPAGTGMEGTLDAIGTLGQLQCLDSAGNVVLDGSGITSPSVSTVYDSGNNAYPAVGFRTTDEAAEALAALDVYETVSVYLDGELIASVNQQQLSTDGAGFIPLTNYATAAEGARAAQRLAAILSSGELPMALENTRLEGISPLMGEGAGMMVSVAVLVALAVAIIGLIARYRLPGAAAALGVAVWALLTVIFLCELSLARMSLSGVAGVLVGLALAAGGFALLLERCSRESRSYAPASALRRAWRSALTAFADGGVAVLLAGLAMYFLGNGAVKNFSAALLVSTLCALAVLVLLSRFLVGNGLQLGAKVFSPKVDLAGTKAAAPSRLRVLVPVALGVVALVMQLCGAGLQAGLDFGDGAVIRYALGEGFALADVASAAEEAGVDAYQVVKAEATAETTADDAATDDTATGADGASVADDTAAADDAPVADGTSAADDTSVADDTSAADNTSVADGTSAADGASAADDASTDNTAAAGTAVATGGMTDVEIRVLGADAASLEEAQAALLTALSSRYAGARLVSLEDVSATGMPMVEVWAPLAGCLLAAIYLAIRFGIAGGVAALAACLFDALTALALSAIFGWALPAEGAFPAAIAFACVSSLLVSALVLNRYRGTLRAPGAARVDAATVLAEDARAVRGRALSTLVPLVLAAACMLVLGPNGVRAMGLPLLAGALSAASSATGLTGRVWASLSARLHKGNK